MSHSSMQAFFSSVDIADEVSSRYFAVFGKVDQEQIDFVVRVASNKQSKDLTFQDVFDIEKELLKDDSNYTVNFEEALELVKEIANVVSPHARGSLTGSASVPTTKSSVVYDGYERLDYYGYNYSGQYDVKASLRYDIKTVDKSKKFSEQEMMNLGESVANLITEAYLSWEVKPEFQQVVEAFDTGFNLGLLDEAV